MLQVLQKKLRQLVTLFHYSDEIVMSEGDFARPIQFEKIYPNKNPIVIEFGVGKGRFIRDYANQNPQKNFLGVEKVNQWVKHSALRIEKAKLTNVRLVQSSAEYILSLIPKSSICEYYVLFPDPWPKRRHNNRRIFQKNFLSQIHHTLMNGGKLYIATDHKDYFSWIENLVNPMLEKQFQIIRNQSPEFISNYQVKYEKEGRPIYTMHLKKI